MRPLQAHLPSASARSSSAPAFASSRIASVCPAAAAQWSGVLCQRGVGGQRSASGWQLPLLRKVHPLGSTEAFTPSATPSPTNSTNPISRCALTALFR